MVYFKSSESETTYKAAYAAMLELWSVPYEALELQSRFGKTFGIVSGPPDAPPLVVLHGFFTTLLLWIPNIAELSKTYRVVALDIMGNRNRSIPAEPIGDTTELMEWLCDALDQLGLQKVHIMGMSYGGWIAIKFALTAPERINKLVLIAPAASLLPLSKQFMPRAILSSLPPRKYWFHSFMGWMGVKRDREFSRRLLDLMWLAGQHIVMSKESMRVMPTVYTDDELKSIAVRTLLLIGENEVIYDATSALHRAVQLIPDLVAEKVPSCGHDISFNQHELVDSHVLSFLGGDKK